MTSLSDFHYSSSYSFGPLRASWQLLQGRMRPSGWCCHDNERKTTRRPSPPLWLLRKGWCHQWGHPHLTLGGTRPHVHLGYHLLVGKCFYTEHKPLPGESIIVSLDRVQYRRRLQFISSVLTTPLKVSVPSGGLMELGKPPKPYNLTLKRGCEALTTKSTFQGDMQRKLLCLFGGWLLSWSCTKPLLKKGTNLLELGGGRKGERTNNNKNKTHASLFSLQRLLENLPWPGGSCRGVVRKGQCTGPTYKLTQSEHCNGRYSWGSTTHPTLINSPAYIFQESLYYEGSGQDSKE